MNRETYVVTQYDDCLAVLKDGETFSSRSNAEVGKIMGRTIIEMDGKEHTRTRALVQHVFVAAGPRRARAGARAAWCTRSSTTSAGSDAPTWSRSFTERFPVQVIAHMVGVPRSDYPQFQRWAIDIIGFAKDSAGARRLRRAARVPAADHRRAPRAAARRRHQRARHRQGRRRGPDRRGGGQLPAAAPAGRRGDDVPADRQHALRAPHRARARCERVRADRSLVPVGRSRRRCAGRRRCCSSRGRRPGRRRDPRRRHPGGRDGLDRHRVGEPRRAHYADPDRFDLDRRADDHLSFGFGRHLCLGYHLARSRRGSPSTRLLDRLPDLRLDPDAPPPTITGLAFRSPKTLPVLLG